MGRAGRVDVVGYGTKADGGQLAGAGSPMRSARMHVEPFVPVVFRSRGVDARKDASPG